MTLSPSDCFQADVMRLPGCHLNGCNKMLYLPRLPAGLSDNQLHLIPDNTFQMCSSCHVSIFTEYQKDSVAPLLLTAECNSLKIPEEQSNYNRKPDMFQLLFLAFSFKVIIQVFSKKQPPPKKKTGYPKRTV